MKRNYWLACITLLSGMAAANADDRNTPSYDLDIDALPLMAAVKSLSDETGIEVLYFSEIAEGVTSSPVKGEFTPQEALETMLDRTDLEVVQLDQAGAVAIRPAEEPGGDSDSKNLSPTPALMTHYQESETQIRESTGTSNSLETAEVQTGRPATQLEEIIVTGTNIRGVENPTVPIIELDSEYFEQSGYLSTADVFRDLPQNFAELSSATTGIVVPSGSSFNGQQSTSIDLRGLGSDATLVLINGRRLVPSGSNTSVDISLIPLSAIERVDILTDGGSAVYGSDAVGGVVNFILKDDYEGAETYFRYSTPTRDGGGQTFAATQLLGANWTGGNAFLAYEFSDSRNLTADERSFSASASDFFLPELFDLAVSAEAQKVLVNLNQQLGDRLSLDAYGLYAFNDSRNRRFEVDGLRINHADNEQVSLALELAYDLSDAATLTIGGTYNIFDGRNTDDNPGENEFRIFDTRDDAYTFDAKVSGSLVGVPAGKISYAFGGEYRSQESSFLGSGDALDVADRQQERDVTSVFVEVIVPFFSEENQQPLLESLQLSLAARYDDISDAGSRTTPQVGLSWSPTESLTFRSSYGESFKAPRFAQQTGRASVGVVTSSDPLADDGRTPYLFVSASPFPGELEPETAQTLTVGLDYSPAFLEGFTLSASYFDIEFENRVGAPQLGGSLSVLERENEFIPGIVIRNPSPAEIAVQVDRASTLFNISDLFGDPFVDFADVEAIVDFSTRNIARQEISGIDITGRYGWDSDWGDFGFLLNVNYLLELDQQDQPGAAVVELVDTFLNPVDLRARVGLTWSRGALSGAVFVDYVDSYENPDEGTTVDAWTTADLRLAADVGDLLPQFRSAQGFEASLLVQNIFDTDPPFVDSTRLFQPVGFDPINADPLGRVVALELSKRW